MKKPSFNFDIGQLRSIIIWVLIIAGFIFLPSLLDLFQEQTENLDYSAFVRSVDEGKVKSVVVTERQLTGKYEDGKQFKTLIPYDDNDLIRRMVEKNISITVKTPNNFWSNLLPYLIPLLMFLFFWIFFIRQMNAGQNRAFTFGKSNATLVLTPKVTFKDVAGCVEAKEELQEVIDFLKHPGKYVRLGGRIPRGVLLLGSPGTGKTLLAKAIAGEAKVPFFSISGSDFVEMFVGVGASRVRDLFTKAKSHAPAIMFIDEIDAVGRHRGAGIGGGHDEREQTLNQLLVEMDGFSTDEGIIIIAATNRPDILDPALLRPGRFDRRVVVDLPDIKGREDIFKIHTRKVPLSDEMDFELLAKSTPGFTGADIANMVNEAALLAARRDKVKVEMSDFEEAKDKVIMGLARRSAVISKEEKRISAYHESGHVICSKKLKFADPVHKVTVIPRGMALGVTQFLPIDDKHTYSKHYLQDQLVSLLGGRAAELLVLDSVTTGASNDIEKATKIAHKMVCEWGMSEDVGAIQYANPNDSIFIGREIAQRKDYSEATAQIIDREVKRLVDSALDRAISILKENEGRLHKMAEVLLDKETLTSEEIDMILDGREEEIIREDKEPVKETGKEKDEEQKEDNRQDEN